MNEQEVSKYRKIELELEQAFYNELKNLCDSANNLANKWQELENETGLIVNCDEYPKYLPSFDDFTMDLFKWKESLK